MARQGYVLGKAEVHAIARTVLDDRARSRNEVPARRRSQDNIASRFRWGQTQESVAANETVTVKLYKVDSEGSESLGSQEIVAKCRDVGLPNEVDVLCHRVHGRWYIVYFDKTTLSSYQSSEVQYFGHDNGEATWFTVQECV